ncbi:MAG: MATE family efflux transporter [Lachnospiraceae bacterium]|nr:MATE family efflux transporter [Lachnospiraceae bacterium]
MARSQTINMTTGSPAKHILRFAFPLLIGNLFQQLYNMVDSMVVGTYVGSNALAAVGTCGSTNFLFFALSSGLAIGIGVIVAQFFGADDEGNVRATIANSIYVLTMAALTVSLVGFVAAPYILSLLNVPDSILGLSVLYMRTTCMGILGVATYNGVSAVLRALGDSRTPLYFLILSSLMNVALDLVFVRELSLGVFGVALATVLSQYASAIACLIYAYIRVPYFRLTKEELKPDARIIKRSFRLGVPIALQSSMIAVSCMVLQGVVNGFGETVMAAYTVTMRIEQLVQQPYSSLASAVTTYSGQNIGAGNVARVKKGFRQSVLIVLIFSLAMIPVMYFGGEFLVRLFVKDNEEAVRIAFRALRITSLCYFGLGMIYVPRGLMNGCGDAAFSMINGISEVVCRLSFAQIFTRIPAIGFWGVWLTTGATWAATGAVCLIRYFQGAWKHKAITGKTPSERGEGTEKPESDSFSLQSAQKAPGMFCAKSTKVS